ncbi:MAG: flagellin, partial [Jatrophihabitantaceae bacterium]
MSLRINTNVAALNAYNNLNANQTSLNNAFSQLSSGLRINKAADDASGLAISQGLTSQINGLTQAVSNAQDATNVAQIADGALGTTQSILQRMRTLVVQSGNTGTQDSASLGDIQAEITALNSQLDSISSSTKFGSTALLDGSYSGVFQVGATSDPSDQITLTLAGSDSATLGTDAVDVTTAASFATNLTAIDGALSTVSTERAGIGATQNQLNYTVSNLQTGITNVTASRSNLTDADL